jgi:hypothetical protein
VPVLPHPAAPARRTQEGRMTDKILIFGKDA